MVLGEMSRPLRAKLFMARRCFKCNVLRILLSEFDEDLNEPSSGVEERSYVIAMSVIITSAEHDCWIGFVS